MYAFEQEDVLEAKEIIEELQKGFGQKIMTEVLMFEKFKENKEEYQNYYLKNPEKEFCRRYIQPKLGIVRKEEQV